MTNQVLRDTFSECDLIMYRNKSVETILGLTGASVRDNVAKAGITIKRANEINSSFVSAMRLFTIQNIFDIAAWRRSVGLNKGLGLSRPVIIAVSVIKGGTGKTTTAVETAIQLQLKGLRVLCIDLDIQANMTQLMGYEPDLLPEEAESFGVSRKAIVEYTLADVLLPTIVGGWKGKVQPMSQIVKKPFGESGPHLIPADMSISEIDSTIINSRGARELNLRTLLRAKKREIREVDFDATPYDVVIIDCPPNLSMMSTNAIAAADIVLAPVRMDSFSIKGLSTLTGEVASLHKNYKMVTPGLFILPTHYAPKIARTARMQAELEKYAEHLSTQVISSNEEFPKYQEGYIPLSLAKPLSKGAGEYAIFADLLTKRLRSLISKNLISK